MARWGIDLGGTKIEGIILDGRDPEKILVRERIPTEADRGYVHIMKRIGRVIEILREKSGLQPEKIGICTPGAIDPATGLLKNSNTVVLNGKPFAIDLAEYLGLPLKMANDANCFALAETSLGVVRKRYPDASVIFGVIMGTGVGGGVVVNRQIIPGRHGIGGEWGHNYLDSSGGSCYCGRQGCVETIISGPALEGYYRQISGKALSLPEINKAFLRAEDPFAEKTIERLLHFFSKGIAQVINILDPDVIVLGGGVSNIHALYSRGTVPNDEEVFNSLCSTPVVAAELGDSAGVIGAALLID